MVARRWTYAGRKWPTAYQPGDPRVGASPRTRESTLGLLELTPAELRDLQEALERLLESFTTPGETPAGAAPARVLAFFMPEPPAAT
jgi:hypothetical protein